MGKVDKMFRCNPDLLDILYLDGTIQTYSGMHAVVNSIANVPVKNKISFPFLLETPKDINSRPDSVCFVATPICF